MRAQYPIHCQKPGLHQAHHPLPARNEWGEDRGEGKPIRTPPPLTHPMEEREKSRSLMQPWRERRDGRIPLDYCALSLTNRSDTSARCARRSFGEQCCYALVRSPISVFLLVAEKSSNREN